MLIFLNSITDSLNLAQTQFRSQTGAFPSATEARNTRIGSGTVEESSQTAGRGARNQ